MVKDKQELSNGKESLYKGDLQMSMIFREEKIFDREVVGLKDLRINLSELVAKAINGFEEIISGNAKVGGKTASIIATNVLDDILEVYRFNPVFSYDEETKQHEIKLEEISVYASGDTQEEALKVLVDLVIDNTIEFLENKELYMRIPEMKKKFPYFLRLYHCNSLEELIGVLNLDNLKI